MGRFVPSAMVASTFAVIDESSGEISSPFSRSNRESTDRHRSLSRPGVLQQAENADRYLSEIAISGDETPNASETIAFSQVSASEELSSTEGIELDDVLESAFLSLDPVNPPNERSPDDTTVVTGRTPHSKNLSRWDRIPVATFRQTRQVVTHDSPKAESRSSNNFSPSGALGGHAILGSPGPRGKGKKPKTSKSSPSPASMGGETPTGHPIGSPLHQLHIRQNKSRKDARLERVAKRKIVEKASPRRTHHHHQHHHPHYPNMKSRGTSSLQRTGSSFASSSSSFPHPSF